MVTLSILEPQLDELLAAIFAEQPNEGAAFLICGISRTDREDRLLVREVVPVERAHYLVREPQRLSIDSQAYANAAKHAEADGCSVVFVHSHPGGVGEFSPQDDREEPKLMMFLDARVPGRQHGSLVVATRSDLRGRAWVRGRWADIVRIRVLALLDHILDGPRGRVAASTCCRQSGHQPIRLRSASWRWRRTIGRVQRLVRWGEKRSIERQEGVCGGT